jgi:L-2-hydroxyglutarate oxidase LhgO
MNRDCDAVVIGAGVIGIAVARALALDGADVVLLEPEARPLQHTSSRNSEVIHAGLYYPPGSYKALLCTTGRERLYAYLDARDLPHRRCGKLVVATDATERETLAGIMARAQANAVPDLAWLEAGELQARAPAIAGVAALHVPVTGIVDSHAFAMALLAEAETAGCSIAFGQRATAIEADPDGPAVVSKGADGASTRLRAGRVVNCAGHGAVALYHACRGYGPRRDIEGLYAKGNYTAVSGAPPAAELVYPVPQPHGLGVHVTFDLGDHVRLGPDVEWTDSASDLAVDPAFAERARDRARGYWPGIDARRVRPDYAGVRPKVRVDGELASDFLFVGDRTGKAAEAAVLHCLGLESPGLTAALAIGDEVVAGRLPWGSAAAG